MKTYTFYVVVNEEGRYAVYDWTRDGGTTLEETMLIRSKDEAYTIAAFYDGEVKEVTVAVKD